MVLAKFGDDQGRRFACGKASFCFATKLRPRVRPRFLGADGRLLNGAEVRLKCRLTSNGEHA